MLVVVKRAVGWCSLFLVQRSRGGDFERLLTISPVELVSEQGLILKLDQVRRGPARRLDAQTHCSSTPRPSKRHEGQKHPRGVLSVLPGVGRQACFSE